jgi:hypothetical protein
LTLPEDRGVLHLDRTGTSTTHDFVIEKLAIAVVHVATPAQPRQLAMANGSVARAPALWRRAVDLD